MSVQKFGLVAVIIFVSLGAGVMLPNMLAPTPSIIKTLPGVSPTTTSLVSPTATTSPTATPSASPTSTPSPLATTALSTGPSVTSIPGQSGNLALLPTATSPPRLTSTPTPTATFTSTATATSTATVAPASASEPMQASGPVQRRIPPTATPIRPTPTKTNTPLPKATPTPAYDYVVVSFKEIPKPEYRNMAYIRGKLIDRNGNLVKGAQFEIQSDGTPIFTAIEPQTPGDGTVEFPVTAGRFIVWVVGGRSEQAGWMVTGQAGQPTMSDWEFVFQTTH